MTNDISPISSPTIDNKEQDDTWSSQKYVKNASFVPVLGAPVVKLLDPQAHERILDLGAGDGVLTIELEKKCKSVVAIDSSSDMIRAAAIIGCQDARVVDGHDLVDNALANGDFDAVFSNAALHWMKKDPVRVIQGVNKSLKTGGRFVAEMGGHMNVAEVRGGLHAALKKRGINNPEQYDPWFFPGVNTYKRMLEESGFRVDYIELIPRLTPLSTDVAGWIDTFGFMFMKPFENNEEEKKAIAQEVQNNLTFSQDEGVWHIMYVRLRFKATKIN
ncbi:hypothetical protein BX616_004410 [Lobosporangium transversale]|uniref:S-adenosyl-L-methionine-dependent methyltransferase n=1 Tax=Lobosporangium transversale TaxID=64571 RepID=A0A1Y2GPH5_9FUNG|nr:S-adenosyl-L-methionine-dependent methyltransferase [Lobosporangium transversale]KAF9918901.1 hypothetical protein BX616_004410 [Lobosporangium transversale]ORZ16175.1 S-adenosyl-L-methionine-dependent methyltransferase [Lobosporangium transversale]|eukprot:XP_021881522.1 S-adenosyl-L-methionine-dependent methyltransferase [Lobosporangium transversale]